MGRAPCCDKANVKKGPWSPEEDAKLKAYIQDHGTGGNWIALPQKVGLKRCGKSCRLRWLNYLRPNIKHGGFSEEEDNIICNFFLSIGSRWSIIAAQLPGRTDNDIKNYWNTKLKKKLMGKRQTARREMVIRGRNSIEPKLIVSDNMTNPLPYYPELPMHMPPLDVGLNDCIIDQDSITSYTNLKYPFEYLFPYQDLAYDNLMNSLSSTTSMNGDCLQLPSIYQGSNYEIHEQLESCIRENLVNFRSE